MDCMHIIVLKSYKYLLSNACMRLTLKLNHQDTTVQYFLLKNDIASFKLMLEQNIKGEKLWDLTQFFYFVSRPAWKLFMSEHGSNLLEFKKTSQTIGERSESDPRLTIEIRSFRKSFLQIKIINDEIHVVKHVI